MKELKLGNKNFSSFFIIKIKFKKGKIYEQWNKKERREIYEIDGKKYTVISRVIDNPNNIDRLYDVLAKFALERLKDNKQKLQ